MKLKRILGALLSLSIVAGSSSFVMAEDGDFVKFGTPYDITLGQETTELVEGHKIAIPYEITSTTGSFTSYTVVAEYDSNYVTPGFEASYVDNEEFNLYDLATNKTLSSMGLDLLKMFGASYVISDTDTSEVPMVGAIKGFGLSGTQYVNVNYTKDGLPADKYCGTNFNHTASVSTDASSPEGYLLFTVVKSLSDDDNNLNVEVVKPYSARCELADGADKTNQINIAGEAEKFNACDGAFQVVVDGSQLPYWVQGINVYTEADYNGDRANGKALSEYVNSDGTTVYTFPARVTSDNINGEIKLYIVAEVSDVDDKDGSETYDVDWGNVTISMDGSVTGYDTELDLSQNN